MCRETFHKRGSLPKGVLAPWARIEREATLFENGRLWRQRATRLISGGKLAGLLLACFDVGLVERVDPEDRARYRGRDLPTENLLTDVVAVGHIDPHDGMPRLFERGDGLVLLPIGPAGQPHVDKQAILAVDVG